MTFGERLRLMRITRDLKQEDIANALGIGRVTYTNYEGDVRFPSIEILMKLSEYFDVTLDYLVTGKEKARDIKPAFELTRVISKLSPGEKTLLQKIDYIQRTELSAKDIDKYFLFKVTEPTMTGNRTKMGDMLLCEIDDTLIDNQLVVALVNGTDTVLGRVFRERTTVVLQPENLDCRPYIFDMAKTDQFTIAGKVLEGKYTICEDTSDKISVSDEELPTEGNHRTDKNNDRASGNTFGQ